MIIQRLASCSCSKSIKRSFLSVKDLTFGGLNIIIAGDFFQSLFHITVSYLYFTMHLSLTLNSMLSDVRKGTLRTYDTARSLVTDLRTIESLSLTIRMI